MMSDFAFGAGDELGFEIVQREFEPGGILMRIVEALDALVEHAELRARVLARGSERRRIIDNAAAAQNGHQQVLVFSAGREMLAARRIGRIGDRDTPGQRTCFVPDGVADEFPVLKKTADLEHARVGHLHRLLGELDLVVPATVGLADGGELVNAAEGGLIVGSDEHGADAPDVDGRALLLEAGDEMFVEIVAADDHGLFATGRVENFPRLDAEIGEVAGIKADAAKLMAVTAEFPADLDRVADTLEGIVGVDEENAIVR